MVKCSNEISALLTTRPRGPPSEDVKFTCIDSRSFYCYLITDKGLIVLISDHNFVFIQFSPRHSQNYFSSYDTDKSVTRRGEGRTLRKRLGTPTSRIWFVPPVIVILINWAATYDEVFIVLVMVVAKAILLFFQLLHFIT